MSGETREYLTDCPKRSCDMQFIGATKEDVLEHVKDAHGKFAYMGASLMGPANDCPTCDRKKEPEADYCLFCRKVEA